MSRSQFGQMARGEGGAVVVIVAVMLTALLGLGAIVIDAGALYSERRQLQTAADAAALAGVQELPGGDYVGVATQYASINASWLDDDDEIIITNEETFTPGDTVLARLRNVDARLLLARFLGWETTPVSASAAAVVASPSRYANLLPFGLMPQSWEESSTVPSFDNYFGYEFGTRVELAVSVGDEIYGNFHMLTLEGQPQNVLKARVAGTTGPDYEIGQTIELAPGFRGSVTKEFADLAVDLEKNCTHDSKHYWSDDPAAGSDPANVKSLESVPLDPGGKVCSRVVVVPIIVNPAFPKSDSRHWNWTALKGASDPVEIVGFARIFIDETEYIKSTGKEGKDEPDVMRLWGYFLDVVDPSALDYGAYQGYGLRHWLLTQ